MHMSNKVRTTLTLSRDVVIRAKELDINISAAAERGIIEYIHTMENIRRKRKQSINNNPPQANGQDIVGNTNCILSTDLPGVKQPNRRDIQQHI